jgi:hypothetical protein
MLMSIPCRHLLSLWNLLPSWHLLSSQQYFYKLRMMGVSISGPSYIYRDNMSVIRNTQWPKLTLKKKSNSVCYHAVCESVAMGESLMGHIPMNDNPADLLMKLIPGGMKQDDLVSLVLHDICNDRPWFVPPTLGLRRLQGSLVTVWLNIRTQMISTIS